MTQPSVPPRNPNHFVLHPSVATGWWLDYLPYAGRAIQFRTIYLRAGHVTVYGVPDIELHVLELLAHELGKESLGAPTAWPLADDVFRIFRSMRDEKIITSDRNRMLARGAFQIAAHYGLSFYDACILFLPEAARYHCSLPIGRSTHGLEIELSGVRVTLLQDYLP